MEEAKKYEVVGSSIDLLREDGVGGKTIVNYKVGSIVELNESEADGLKAYIRLIDDVGTVDNPKKRTRS